MDGLLEIVATVEQKTAANVPRSSADYMENGLLYCGKCHTPKEFRGNFLGMVKVVPCLCQCRADELAAEEQQRKAEKQRERIMLNRRASFLESDMQHWNFAADDGADARIMRAAKSYVANFTQFREQGKGLLLYGGVGTGKTFAAACIANALIDTGRTCLMTNFARVLNTLWSIEEKQAYIDSFNQFDLLVLDDLGAERRSEYAQEQVFNVIDGRYRSGLPLIITTNLGIDKIKKPDTIGNARIYDRVLEMCHSIELSGQSRRRKKVAEEFKSMNELLGL